MTALALNISNTPIRQDLEGRYCLNDLHKASGGELKHRPGLWMENQQTKDLVSELEKDEAGIPASKFSAISILRGRGIQGTYAVKELVYAYAMWISPAFTLKVIHAYDSLVSVQYGLKQLPEPPTITKAQQGVLFNKVAGIAAGRGQIRSQLWSRFQNHFKLSSYKDLPADQFDDALAYLKSKQYEYNNGVEMLYVSNVELAALVDERVKVLEGELLGKSEQPHDPFMTDNNYRHEARKAINAHLDACHADMKQAGLTPPAWPEMSEQTITGLASSLLWQSRWLMSFNPDNMKPQLMMIPMDAQVQSFKQWVKYAQSRGYLVIKKSDLEKLQA